MKKLNITFCSFPDYSNNAKALYEYMKKRYKDDMNYMWIVSDKENSDRLNKKGINNVISGTEEFEEYIKTTDVFFTTHANLVGAKTKAKKAIYVELWHGFGPKPIGFLLNNISDYEKEWFQSINKSIDYLIVPSDFWRVIFSSAFDLNSSRIKPLGFPVLEDIKKSDGIKNISMVLGENAKKYNKIIMYMPTFKKRSGNKLEAEYNEHNILNLENYSDDELQKYLKKNKYLLIVKRHPSDKCNYTKIESKFIKNIDDNILGKYDLDVNDILNAADLLITDYSSVGVAYSILDRPIIYLSVDLKDYEKNRGIIFNNYSFWTEGEETTNYEDLIKKINLLIGHKYHFKNKELFFKNLNDGGCSRICDFIFSGDQLSKNLVRQDDETAKINYELHNLNSSINNTKYIISEQEETIKKLTESDIRLKEIENSKSWRMLEKIRKIIRR